MRGVFIMKKLNGLAAILIAGTLAATCFAFAGCNNTTDSGKTGNTEQNQSGNTDSGNTNSGNTDSGTTNQDYRNADGGQFEKFA